MKKFYKGFDLQVKKAKKATGGNTLYATAIRRDDGWELAAHPSIETKNEEMEILQVAVDQFYHNPEIYDAPKIEKQYPEAKKRKVKSDEEE